MIHRPNYLIQLLLTVLVGFSLPATAEITAPLVSKILDGSIEGRPQHAFFMLDRSPLIPLHDFHLAKSKIVSLGDLESEKLKTSLVTYSPVDSEVEWVEMKAVESNSKSFSRKLSHSWTWERDTTNDWFFEEWYRHFFGTPEISNFAMGLKSTVQLFEHNRDVDVDRTIHIFTNDISPANIDLVSYHQTTNKFNVVWVSQSEQISPQRALPTGQTFLRRTMFDITDLRSQTIGTNSRLNLQATYHPNHNSTKLGSLQFQINVKPNAHFTIRKGSNFMFYVEDHKGRVNFNAYYPPVLHNITRDITSVSSPARESDFYEFILDMECNTVNYLTNVPEFVHWVLQLNDGNQPIVGKFRLTSDMFMSHVERNVEPILAKLGEFNVLVIGPIGAGKSTFCNVILTVGSGAGTAENKQRLASRTGLGSDHTTSTVKSYSMTLYDGRVPINFIDTPGITESNWDDEFVEYLLNGWVPDNHNYGTSTVSGLPRKTIEHMKPHSVLLVLPRSLEELRSMEPLVVNLRKVARLSSEKGITMTTMVTGIVTPEESSSYDDTMKTIAKKVGVTGHQFPFNVQSRTIEKSLRNFRSEIQAIRIAHDTITQGETRLMTSKEKPVVGSGPSSKDEL